MRVSRKAQHALRAIVALARKPDSATVSIDELSTLAGIPSKFLEQILLTLKRAGLLRSRRGVGGGYQLGRPPHALTLRDILTAVDGPFHPIDCTAPDPAQFGSTACECKVPGGCGLGSVFTDLQRLVNDFLERTTIEEVLSRQMPREVMHFEI